MDLVRLIFGCTFEKKENTAQLSTAPIATQAVANAAAEEAAATTTHELHDEDPNKNVEVIARINAEPKPEQLSISTTAAQTVANAAAEKAAAGAAALARAAAEQTVAIDAVEQAAAINADAKATATVNNLHEEIKRLQRLLQAEQAATAAARAAADEAAATINNLEVESRRVQLLLAAENAAKTAKVYVPGYVIPMTSEEHLKALQRQVQYLQEQLHAQAIPSQWRADRVIMAENANVEEAAMASISPVPPIANEPARGEHTRAQPTPLANLKSNSATYAEVVMSSVPDGKQRTRTNDNGRVHPANAASSLATAGTEPPMSPTVLRHNFADNAEAALQAAALQAAAKDPRILRTVLLAAAATANALAQTIQQVLEHRRGGRPPPTRRANGSQTQRQATQNPEAHWHAH